MNTGIVYAVTAFVCMLQIALILDRTQATKYKETIDLEFCKILLIFVFFCLIDMMWGVIASGQTKTPPLIYTVVSYGYHLVAGLSAFFGVNYGMNYVNASKRERRLTGGIRYLLLTVQVLVLFSNLWTHRIFFVDDNCHYHMGEWRIYPYLLQYAYYVLLICLAVYNALTGSKGIKRYKTALSYAVISLVFGIGQYLFYNIAMYAMGFAVSAFGLYIYKITAQREFFMEERLSSLDRRQSSIIQGLAGDFLSIYYVNIQTGHFDIYRRAESGTGLVMEENKDRDYFESVIENGKRIVIPEDQEKYLKWVKKETILNRLEEKGAFDIVVRVRYQEKIQYFKYCFVRPASRGEENRIIIGVYNVDQRVREELAKQEQIKEANARENALKAQASRLDQDANMDALTGLYNRRAYEKDIRMGMERQPGKEFAYLSFDLNHLKTVNDTDGHEAGDELLKGASSCLTSCFGAYGRIYRIGGDEFVGMIYVPGDQMDGILKDFRETMQGWSGTRVKSLSLSFGVVRESEASGMSLQEIGKLADRRMYQDKADYYAEKGLDRRGQRDAFTAIGTTYLRILRVNLTKDLYSVIQSNVAKQRDYKEASKRISEWFGETVFSGDVFEEDRDCYLKYTDMNYLKAIFTGEQRYFGFCFRRMVNGVPRRTMMEIIPANDYSEDNQVVFLYLKDVDAPMKTE